MADNRVVIKINYDKDKHRKEVIDPRMITEWHTGRILAAVSILTLTIIILLFWWSRHEDPNNKTDASFDGVASEQNLPKAVSQEIVADSKVGLDQSNQGGNDNSRQQAVIVSKLAAIILDKRVIRASLNMSIKDKEPGEPLLSAISIDSGKAQQLFYFSQIKNVKDKTLFHHWLKDGQIVHKKQFDIKDDKSKLISSRIFSLKDIGDWQVVLVDRKGKLFSEVRFKVN